ncbi:MAG: hypothetical protein IPJ65_38030 [Archangiaceae bacterium]|nr:hypothetical protein [Archangiaceae bacterium]
MKRAAFSLLLAGCLQTTGGQLVTFEAEAVGTPEAASFTTPKGYDVVLSRARLFVGAVYLNQTNPSNYALETSCILPGIYTGEVRGSLTVDALDGSAQPFPVTGNGTDAPTRAAELWLTDGDVNDTRSERVVLEAEGTASKGDAGWPFSAVFTIGSNRKQPPRDPALPGSRPICKERIVTPIPTDLTLGEGGTLRLTIDPRLWFSAVEFSELTPSSSAPARFEFIDDSASAGQPDIALYNGIRAAKGPYAFTWR